MDHLSRNHTALGTKKEDEVSRRDPSSSFFETSKSVFLECKGIKTKAIDLCYSMIVCFKAILFL